jgi:2-phospho-L-lactate guanylyltransferase
MKQIASSNLPDIWAVVPAKRFSLAKQRLAPVLSQHERTMLARVMLQDVLTTLSVIAGLAGTIVVSADPSAVELAKQFDARPVNDVLETGVNAAVRQGMEILAADTAVLIVPADIPFAAADDLQSVIKGLQEHDVVVSPAASDGGTNALAMRSRDLIAPCFGEDSYVRHLARAQIKNLRCGVIRSDELGHDIDRPEDLFSPAKPKKVSLTSALLTEFDMAKRLGALPIPVRRL